MFHTEQENIICYKSMKEMERELCDKNFVRCHTSYIVNAVIDAACAGDVDAIDRILRHYDGYINKLCVRKYIDGSGNVHYDVDEYMKRRLQIKLIHSIVVALE